MEKVSISAYTINTTTKVISLTNINFTNKGKIFMIANLFFGRESVIYQPGQKNLFDFTIAINGANTDLTFATLPTGMLNSDPLLIICSGIETLATQSSVASSATAVTLLVAKTTRKSFFLENLSTQILYVKLGTVPTTTSYTFSIAAGGRISDECQEALRGYRGDVTGIWASANGNALITELTY